MLTKDEFTDYKDDYEVFKYSSTTDRYGNEQHSYSDTADFTINVMWHPVTDEASIAEYGERVRNMKKAVLYGDADIAEFDRVQIGDGKYQVVSVSAYNTHRLIQVEKV